MQSDYSSDLAETAREYLSRGSLVLAIERTVISKDSILAMGNIGLCLYG